MFQVNESSRISDKNSLSSTRHGSLTSISDASFKLLLFGNTGVSLAVGLSGRSIRLYCAGYSFVAVSPLSERLQGLPLETSAFKLFTVANLRFQLS